MPRVKIAGQDFDVPDEVTYVEQAMKRALADPTIRARGQGLARQRMRLLYLPTGSQGREGEAGNRRYSVALLAEVVGRRYWIGCEVELDSRLGEYEFHSVSLVVFIERADSMEPLLRAEWEQAPGETPGPHAQPHWHVYITTLDHHQRVRYVLVAEEGVAEEIDEFEPVDASEVGSVEHESVGRFHLAMAAKWHTKGAHAQYEAPDALKVGAWIEGCIGYIRGQLTYIGTFLPGRH